MNDTVLKEKKLRSKEVLHEKFRAILTARWKQWKKVSIFTGYRPNPRYEAMSIKSTRFQNTVRRFDLQIEEVRHMEESLCPVVKIENMRIITFLPNTPKIRIFIKQFHKES